MQPVCKSWQHCVFGRSMCLSILLNGTSQENLERISLNLIDWLDVGGQRSLWPHIFIYKRSTSCVDITVLQKTLFWPLFNTIISPSQVSYVCNELPLTACHPVLLGTRPTVAISYSISSCFVYDHFKQVIAMQYDIMHSHCIMCNGASQSPICTLSCAAQWKVWGQTNKAYCVRKRRWKIPLIPPVTAATRFCSVLRAASYPAGSISEAAIYLWFSDSN